MSMNSPSSLRRRAIASVILSPAILVFLVWIARFAAPDEVIRVGMLSFLAWAAATAGVMAWCMTMYIDYLHRPDRP